MNKTRVMTLIVLVFIGISIVILITSHIFADEKVDKIIETDEILPKKVALTFDDGPSKYTEELLDGLKERGVTATFFVIGENIAGNEKIIKRMYNEGHIIGNHTYSHINLKTISTEAAVIEINETNELIKSIIGEAPTYIRPPFGNWNDKLADKSNMSVVLWDVDPLDWSVLNTQSVVKNVTKYAENGDIILLHDIYETSVEAALQIIDILTKRGYEFVSIEEIMCG